MCCVFLLALVGLMWLLARSCLTCIECVVFFCGFGRFDVAFGVSTGSYPFDLQLLLRFDVPEDGFPSIEDWNHTFTSILLGGLELQREPLDVSISDFKPDGASAASNDCQSLVNVCV